MPLLTELINFEIWFYKYATPTALRIDGENSLARVWRLSRSNSADFSPAPVGAKEYAFRN
jgi:hypothetical protein